MGVLSLPFELQAKFLTVPMHDASWQKCIQNRTSSLALASGQSMQIEWQGNSERDVNVFPMACHTSFSSSDGFLCLRQPVFTLNGEPLPMSYDVSLLTDATIRLRMPGVLGGSPGAAATEKLELTKLNKAAVMKLAKEMGIETREATWRPVDEVRQDIEASLVSQSSPSGPSSSSQVCPALSIVQDQQHAGEMVSQTTPKAQGLSEQVDQNSSEFDGLRKDALRALAKDMGVPVRNEEGKWRPTEDIRWDCKEKSKSSQALPGTQTRINDS